jgi:hypothetical protein
LLPRDPAARIAKEDALHPARHQDPLADHQFTLRRRSARSTSQIRREELSRR